MDSRERLLEERRLPIIVVLGIFLVAKLIHLIKIVTVLSQDLNDYRSSIPAMVLDYPGESTNGLQTDVYVVMGQYMFLIIINAVTMIVTKKMERYLRVVSWLIIFM